MSSPSIFSVFSFSGRAAGGLVTEPSVAENVLPWHLQLMLLFATSVTTHCWCVQIAVNALYVPATGCVITVPPSSDTILPPPTGMSAFLAIGPPGLDAEPAVLSDPPLSSSPQAARADTAVTPTAPASTARR